MPALGVVAFSFASRAEAEEPNPCNARLARAVDRIVGAQSETVVLVAQWEVARGLRHGRPDHVVGPLPNGRYLDTADVWHDAAPLLRRAGVSRVIPVAHPVLHRAKVARLIRRDGFEVLRAPVGHIGFDPSPRNTQWWTRGPLRLGAYALLQALTGRGGH